MLVSLIIVPMLGISIFFYVDLQKELVKIDSLKSQISYVSSERIGIVKNIESLRAQTEKLTHELRDYSGKIQAYEAEISKIETEKKGIAFELTEAEKESLHSGNTLDSVIAQEAALKDELVRIQSDYQELVEALKYAGKEKSALEEELRSNMRQTKGIQLPKIVVKAASPAEGSIVEVSTEYNFFVIDMGKEHGVQIGDHLGIYRNNMLIAKALIENIYDDMSTIQVFSQWRDVDILIGDTVKPQI